MRGRGKRSQQSVSLRRGVGCCQLWVLPANPIQPGGGRVTDRKQDFLGGLFVGPGRFPELAPKA